MTQSPRRKTTVKPVLRAITVVYYTDYSIIKLLVANPLELNNSRTLWLGSPASNLASIRGPKVVSNARLVSLVE